MPSHIPSSFVSFLADFAETNNSHVFFAMLNSLVQFSFDRYRLTFIEYVILGWPIISGSSVFIDEDRESGRALYLPIYVVQRISIRYAPHIPRRILMRRFERTIGQPLNESLCSSRESLNIPIEEILG